MVTRPVLRMEPSTAVLTATRRWLDPVRGALSGEFIAAYLTGSVLLQGFDERRSNVNLLIVARALDLDVLDAVGRALVEPKKPPRFDPMFLTQRQIEKSLDVFPIEWIDIQERHLLLEGQDVLGGLEIPRGNLRAQLEHDLRRTLIALRQSYLARSRHPDQLEEVLRRAASGFATSCRTLLRLQGESPPADAPRVIERVAEVYGVQPEGLLAAHLVRYAEHHYRGNEVLVLYRKFLVEVERLVNAIDQMRVP
jgi:hypothetical protein